MAKEGVKQFGWKRKIGAQISKTAASVFEKEAKDDDDVIASGDVDWLTLVPVNKKRVIGLEDNVGKSERLAKEGAMLAESERYWEAIKKWDEALLYTPCEAKVFEMKAQALMELCEVFPAVQAAKKAVEFAPLWWVAHQTLGRAYLGLGEVRMAVKSFSRALHINPSNKELWEEDLMWAYSLLQKREKVEEEKEQEKKLHGTVKPVKPLTVTEIDGEGSSAESVRENSVEIYKNSYRGSRTEDLTVENRPLKSLPNNYVQMRDT